VTVRAAVHRREVIDTASRAFVGDVVIETRKPSIGYFDAPG
jgi:hypothetical protein